MISSYNFITPIQTSYFRNNRSTRQKSLRCYPSCDPRGHIVGGFCGTPIKVQMCIQKPNDSHKESSNFEDDFKIEEYVFVAELRPEKFPNLASSHEVAADFIKENLRDKFVSNCGELFIASVEVMSESSSQYEVELLFNGQHCSYDYKWKSNRWSGANEGHVLDVIVMRKSNNSNVYSVVSSHPSSPFIIVSSHKKAGAGVKALIAKGESLVTSPSSELLASTRANKEPKAKRNKKINSTKISHIESESQSGPYTPIKRLATIKNPKVARRRYSYTGESDDNIINDGENDENNEEVDYNRNINCQDDIDSDSDYSIEMIHQASRTLASFVNPNRFIFEQQSSPHKRLQLSLVTDKVNNIMVQNNNFLASINSGPNLWIPSHGVSNSSVLNTNFSNLQFGDDEPIHLPSK
eukprot:gene5496-7608_t